MQLSNHTPYRAQHFLTLDPQGFERLLVIVKATFDWSGVTPRLTDEQPPVQICDEYLGDPGSTGLRRAGELFLEKPAADFMVRGCVYAPGGRTATEALAGVQVGDVRKLMAVFGERRWSHRFGAIRPTAPAPFDRIPLHYEHAFGGMDRTKDGPKIWPANPVGRGFRDRQSLTPLGETSLPSFEEPGKPIRSPDDRPPSLNLGPIPPAWSSRARYAGTYGDRWTAEERPRLPADFDTRFHHAVPADQVLPGHLRGGELVTLWGLRPEGKRSFGVPATPVEVTLRFQGERERLLLVCDTLDIDAEAQRLSLVLRGSSRLLGRLDQLLRIEVRVCR
jgi:hypothetical protein